MFGRCQAHPAHPVSVRSADCRGLAADAMKSCRNIEDEHGKHDFPICVIALPLFLVFPEMTGIALVIAACPLLKTMQGHALAATRKHNASNPVFLLIIVL